MSTRSLCAYFAERHRGAFTICLYLLIAKHVHNRGVVLAIAPGRATTRSQWIIVTQEQITGAGYYGDLPPTLHVAVARTKHTTNGWAVSEWTPRN